MKRSLILAFLLAGCAETHTVSTTCLPVKSYSQAFEKQWADELVTLPDSDPLVIVSMDYARVRSEMKACGDATRFP